jgi:hypothetical protein
MRRTKYTTEVTRVWANRDRGLPMASITFDPGDDREAANPNKERMLRGIVASAHLFPNKLDTIVGDIADMPIAIGTDT